jgi:hypothetical protein
MPSEATAFFLLSSFSFSFSFFVPRSLSLSVFSFKRCLLGRKRKEER